MRRQIIILVVLCTVCTFQVSAQIRRPSLDDSIWCQILPDTCTNGEFTRRVPFGPTNDINARYIMPRAVGVTQLNYELAPVGTPATSHFTTYDLMQELAEHNIPAVKLWLENDPFDGMGSWCWHTYWGAESCTNQCDNDCDPDASCVPTPTIEMMRPAWMHPAVDVVFLRAQSMAWTLYQNGCLSDSAPVVAYAPYYDIATRLYDEFWWLDKTIILGDWEQDWVVRGRGCRGWDFPFGEENPWYSNGCQDNCLGSEEDGYTEEECRRYCGSEMLVERASRMATLLDQRQAGVEQARAEARRKYGRTKLNVLHAAVINRYPDNFEDDGPMWPLVAEIIPMLSHKPDLIGVSYYTRGTSVVDTLNWVREVTGYPRYRIYLDEVGERADLQNRDQYQQIMDVVSDYWDWGGRLAFVWMWKQTWCGKNYGMFEQEQPCDGKVAWGETTGGYLAVQELNERGSTWGTR